MSEKKIIPQNNEESNKQNNPISQDLPPMDVYLNIPAGELDRYEDDLNKQVVRGLVKRAVIIHRQSNTFKKNRPPEK